MSNQRVRNRADADSNDAQFDVLVNTVIGLENKELDSNEP
jgi:hypothetical protein